MSDEMLSRHKRLLERLEDTGGWHREHRGPFHYDVPTSRDDSPFKAAKVIRELIDLLQDKCKHEIGYTHIAGSYHCRVCGKKMETKK